MTLFRARGDLVIKVFNGCTDHECDDCSAFITAVNGECTVDVLAQIEEQIGEDEEIFLKGAGEYTFEAKFVDRQQDDMGNVEFPEFWELTEIAFVVPDWMNITHIDESTEKPKCMTCGKVNCGTEFVFDRCIPF